VIVGLKGDESGDNPAKEEPNRTSRRVGKSIRWKGTIDVGRECDKVDRERERERESGTRANKGTNESDEEDVGVEL
jgi:hypothetical protein